MITNERNIGKVSISCDGVWNKNIDYDKLCLVTANGANYVSRKQVPIGIDITNEEYWQKLYSIIITNGFYRIPGDIRTLNISNTPREISNVLGDFINFKAAVDSNNIILQDDFIINATISGIDNSSCALDYMYFGENEVAKYRIYLKADNYYSWKQINDVQKSIIIKVDAQLDEESMNAVANAPATIMLKKLLVGIEKIINWH